MTTAESDQLTLGQQPHAALAVPDRTEAAEQAFLLAMREFLGNELAPAVKAAYQRADVHAADRTTIARRMATDPTFQVWSALRRATQELMWAAVDRSIERQADAIEAAVTEVAGPAETFPGAGKVGLPDYLDGAEIHCMPGGYGAPGDTWRAGARYDRGVYIYTMGQLGPRNDNLSHSILSYLASVKAAQNPATIVDLGCTVGHRTLPYAETFPDADVLGLDVSLPSVRYAAARAHYLGVRNARFMVGDARATGLPADSADLVVSHLLLHEMPVKDCIAAIAESWRLVKPGGLVVHADYGQYDGTDPFKEFMLDWDTYGNNEPYWGEFRQRRLEDLAAEAGVPADRVEVVRIDASRRLQSGSKNASGSLTLLLLYG